MRRGITSGDGFFHVCGEFLIYFLIETVPAEGIGDARPERHGQASCRTRLMAVLTVRQRVTSASSCFLPAAVSW